MRNRALSFRLMTLVGVPAFIWLFAELARVLAEVARRSGPSGIPFDGVVQHKVGELMVAAPLFGILLLGNRWPREQVLRLVDRTRLVMLLGGVLNGVAWYTLREPMVWSSFFRLWCLILLIVGVSGAEIARWLLNRDAELQRVA